MANPELVRTLDYILNRCDEVSIEAVAAAVVRRRRELTMFGGAQSLPDPQRMAKELSGRINIGGSIDALKQSVRDMAVKIIRQEAPELTDEQVNELTRAWVPDPSGEEDDGKRIPRDLLASMIGQFTSFSIGQMSEDEDQGLRKELGAWPDRYWKAFPAVIRLIITEYIKGETTESEFNNKIATALEINS
jgi:hypothetical protein